MIGMINSLGWTSYAKFFVLLSTLFLMSFQQPSYLQINDACPTAHFSTVKSYGGNQHCVYFNNESTGGNSYVWDFGDGTFANTVNPVHTYAQSGRFRVTLTVIGSECTTEFIGTVDVIL